MATCTSCGRDVNGKKFCPDCGTPVQATPAEAATIACPRCGGTIKASTAFCMHCGSSLGAHALAATAAPITAVVQPATRQCPACHVEMPSNSAFCTNCGQSVQAGQTPAPVAAVPSQAFCTNCGSHNNPGARFCNSCGQTLAPGTGMPAQSGVYPQQPQVNTNYPPQQQQYNPNYPQQPYGQPQYDPNYPQQPYGQSQYNAGYPQQPYGQPNPMLGQQPMVLRCPVCMAMAPMGTPACPSCHTNLAGVVPTSSVAPAQAQGQQGGLGGMFQGSGGNMAMGALGGAAAVIGGEMLLHNLENRHEYGRGYDNYGERRDDGLLGGLGDLANDIGLF